MEKQQKIPVIAVVGPTASGKSHLAVQLAKWLHTEVVSADSMQIYRELSIGTAKPTLEEMDGIVHHLVDFLPISESFSVADYVEMARKCLFSIHQKGKIPIVVGGTGLYVRSLLQNLDFTESEKDESLREVLRKKAEEQGVSALVDELRQFDPESADRIVPNNIPRLIRAIEVYRMTGKTMTQLLEASRREPSPYDVCMIGLNYRDRSILYDRINRRVDQMMESGLLNEAEAVLKMENGKTALQAIGYKELQPYFEGDLSLEAAVENMKQGTRRYAKRQLTWFRREPEIHWIYPDDAREENDVLERAKTIVKRCFEQKGIITDEQ